MKSFKIFLLFVLAVFGAYVAYQSFYADSDSSQVHYITEPVKRGTIDKSVLASGSVRAIQRTEVGAQVSGKIQKLNAELGQAVKKGQLIAEIDSEPQQNALNSAQAEWLAYQTQLNAKQVALSVAESSYQRLAKLYTQKSTSLNELDNARNTLALAKANLEESKAKIQLAEIAVNTAKTNLSYTKIIAPIDGVIVSVPVSEGQTVNANQSSPTIVQVADLSQVLIKFEIAEGDIAQVKVDQAVSFNTLAEPNRRYRTEIQSLDPALTKLTDNNYVEQSSNNEAVYYYANAQVANPDQSLRIGMTVQGKITIFEKHNVLLVPNSAIKKRQGKSVVDVLENGKSVERNVEIGISDGQSSEVLSGLNEGEQVITIQRNANEKIGSQSIRMPRF